MPILADPIANRVITSIVQLVMLSLPLYCIWKTR